MGIKMFTFPYIGSDTIRPNACIYTPLLLPDKRLRKRETLSEPSVCGVRAV